MHINQGTMQLPLYTISQAKTIVPNIYTYFLFYFEK